MCTSHRQCSEPTWTAQLPARQPELQQQPRGGVREAKHAQDTKSVVSSNLDGESCGDACYGTLRGPEACQSAASSTGCAFLNHNLMGCEHGRLCGSSGAGM